MKKGSNSVDDVFTRLYNDYEDHKERQKILDEENLPPFSPKINNIKYFNRNGTKRKNNVNNSFDRFVTDNKRNNFFLESQIKVNGEKINDYDNNKKNKNNKVKNVNKFVNKNKNVYNKNATKKNTIKTKKKDNGNKSYRPTQIHKFFEYMIQIIF